MNMNSEEKFNNEVRFVLEKINYEYLAAPKNKDLTMWLPSPYNEFNVMLPQRMKEIIYKLEEWNALKVHRCTEMPNFQDFLILEILQPAFNKIIKKYSTEQNLLICGELSFDLETGDAIYNKVETNFKPDTEEYNLLKALMEKPNKRLSPAAINKALGNDKNSKKEKREIGFILRNVKNKLGIIGKKKNTDLFEPCNGYRIVCK